MGERVSMNECPKNFVIFCPCISLLGLGRPQVSRMALLAKKALNSKADHTVYRISHILNV